MQPLMDGYIGHITFWHAHSNRIIKSHGIACCCSCIGVHWLMQVDAHMRCDTADAEYAQCQAVVTRQISIAHGSSDVIVV